MPVEIGNWKIETGKSKFENRKPELEIEARESGT
jgi:hypothetical protein